eukprot:4419810-Amphidinium_carterae.1
MQRSTPRNFHGTPRTVSANLSGSSSCLYCVVAGNTWKQYRNRTGRRCTMDLHLACTISSLTVEYKDKKPGRQNSWQRPMRPF